MPKSWARDAIRFRPIWSHAAGGTAFAVVWSLAGLALQDGDAIGQSFGTAVQVTDTGGTANDVYIGPESGDITVTVGSPTSGDLVVFFEISRVANDGADTLDIDARLHGLILIIETEAENDE
jgi:hypothetical protein